MKKKKNTIKILFASIAAVLIMAIVVSGIFIKRYIDTYGTIGTVKTKHSTDLYEVPFNANDFQISIYEDLAKLCNSIDDMTVDGELSSLAALVVKSFVADYFTWNNKRGSYDVGGLDYVYGPHYLRIQAQSREYYYADLDLLIKQYGKENLPEVIEITIVTNRHIEEKYEHEYSEYDYDLDETINKIAYYDYYLINATWNYAESENYDTSKLPSHGNFMVVNREGRLEVAFYHEDY